METNNWNKVLMSVFNKSMFLYTAVVYRPQLTVGYNLLESIENWETKVLVEDVDDVGLTTNEFTLIPGEKAEIQEFQCGKYLFENGWSKMYFVLNGYTCPFVLVSVITSWFDTHYYKGFEIAPEQLDSVADISALLEEKERAAFPDLKARFVDDHTIAIDFEGQTVMLDANKRETYTTPERKTDTSTVTIYDDDHDIDLYVKIKIETIPVYSATNV